MYTHTYTFCTIYWFCMCVYTKGEVPQFYFPPFFLSFARKHPSLMFWLPLTYNLQAASKQSKQHQQNSWGGWPVSSSSNSCKASEYTQFGLWVANSVPQSENFPTLILDSAPCSLKPMSALPSDFPWAVWQTVIHVSPQCSAPKFKAQRGRGSGPPS